MSEIKKGYECDNCGSTENLFKVTIMSPCREHEYGEIYCNEHMADVMRDFPEDIEIIIRL